AGAMAIGLVASVTLGVGVLSYSGVLGSSLSATERAKAEVFTGSDLTADVSEVSSIPPSLAPRATHVKAIPLSTFLGVGQMAALVDDAPGADQCWIRGDPVQSERALRRAGVLVFTAVSADEVEQTADLAALAWVFSFLLALGIVTALIAVLGAVLYLQARQRG